MDEMICSLSPILLHLLEINGCNDKLMWDVEHMLYVTWHFSCLVSFTCGRDIYFNQWPMSSDIWEINWIIQIVSHLYHSIQADVRYTGWRKLTPGMRGMTDEGWIKAMDGDGEDSCWEFLLKDLKAQFIFVPFRDCSYRGDTCCRDVRGPSQSPSPPFKYLFNT